MSVGYAFLLSNGATSAGHKTRDLVDEPTYRRIWDVNTDLKVVAILKAREKPDLLKALHTVPRDGRWHPVQIQGGKWQALRAEWCGGDLTTYEYDMAEYRTEHGYRARRAVTFDGRMICGVRCARLNSGYAQMTFDNVLTEIARAASADRYGAGDDEFPQAVS